jgi:hypothetical protein
MATEKLENLERSIKCTHFDITAAAACYSECGLILASILSKAELNGSKQPQEVRPTFDQSVQGSTA